MSYQSRTAGPSLRSLTKRAAFSEWNRNWTPSTRSSHPQRSERIPCFFHPLCAAPQKSSLNISPKHAEKPLMLPYDSFPFLPERCNRYRISPFLLFYYLLINLGSLSISLEQARTTLKAVAYGLDASDKKALSCTLICPRVFFFPPLPFALAGENHLDISLFLFNAHP